MEPPLVERRSFEAAAEPLDPNKTHIFFEFWG
jgi:hypothetical protein